MRQIILLICILIYANNISAQVRYYDADKLFLEDGYTYQCDVEKYGLSLLYNKENILTDTVMARKDGLYWRIGISNEYQMASLLEDEAQQEIKYTTILNNAFAEYENSIKGTSLYVRMVIDSDYGKLLETSFSFITKSGFATIPVPVYRQIEIELKKHIQYPVTDNGKKMNFIARQIIYKYNDKANQNCTDSIAAPKASRIFSNPDFSTGDWQELESAIEIITANCIGLNLYDALLGKYNENNIFIRKKLCAYQQ